LTTGAQRRWWPSSKVVSAEIGHSLERECAAT
jgi:hypothetical protein